MSQLEVDKIIPQSGTTLTIGDSGDTISLPSGVSLDTLTITGDLTVDTDTLFVDSTNNRVGIGTSSPSQPLHVVGGAVEFQNTQSTYLQVNPTDTHLYTGGAHPLRFGTNSAERMRIDSSGNVGIGTSSPVTQLHVSGTNAVLNITRSTKNIYLNPNYGNGNVYGTIEYDLAMAFNTAGSERMRIDDSGDLLVAKTSEGLSNNGIELRATGQILATSTNDAGLFYRKTSSTGAGVILTYSDVGGTESLVGAGYANGTFGAVSDINKKKNVENARNYLDDLMQIRVVKYNWKTDEDDTPKELGWIAQEVAEVFPAMVSEIDGNVLLKKEVFLPMMLKSIQELKADNDALRTRIETLENE